MIRVLMVCGLSLMVPARVAAQSPCAASATAYQRNPNKVAIQDPQLALVNPDGTPFIQTVTVGFAKQATPGTQDAQVVLTRAAFTLDAAGMNCYVAAVVLPTQVALNTGYVSVARFTTPDGITGPSSTVSNPFFQAGVATAPGSIRIAKALLRTFVKMPALAARRFFSGSPNSKQPAGK